jgi:hypothetical protein
MYQHICICQPRIFPGGKAFAGAKDEKNRLNPQNGICLNSIHDKAFDKGYISSDTITSDICKKLIEKYKLNIINENEVKTIMFASTCNNLILSGGTFSWLIAFLAYYSKNIYYPYLNNCWYGDIFQFPSWNCIKFN